MNTKHIKQPPGHPGTNAMAVSPAVWHFVEHSGDQSCDLPKGL